MFQAAVNSAYIFFFDWLTVISLLCFMVIQFPHLLQYLHFHMHSNIGFCFDICLSSETRDRDGLWLKSVKIALLSNTFARSYFKLQK